MKGIAAYQENAVTTQSPGKVVVLLYEGAIKFLTRAAEEIENGNPGQKGYYINKGIDIVDELNASLDIEAGGFEFPWSEEDFVRCLRQRNCIGMVAEHEDRVAGFMIYELHKSRIHVLNFAVAKDYRRRGVGSQMIAKLIAKLSVQRRSRVVLEVRETNLAAQLFFRETGFRAISVLHNFYEDSPEDAYLMQYRFRSKPNDPVLPSAPGRNRLEFPEHARDRLPG
mgnify:CR=1 FL=1